MNAIIERLFRLRHSLIMLWVIVVAILFAPSVALAGEDLNGSTINTIRLSPLLVVAITTLLQPYATALLTHAHSSAAKKRIVTAIISAVVTFVSQATLGDGSAVFSPLSIIVALISFLGANVSYVTLWSQPKTNKSINNSKAALPHKGI